MFRPGIEGFVLMALTTFGLSACTGGANPSDGGHHDASLAIEEAEGDSEALYQSDLNQDSSSHTEHDPTLDTNPEDIFEPEEYPTETVDAEGNYTQAYWKTLSLTAPAVIGHSATVLLDGQVLIVGGRSREGNSIPIPIATTTLYNPKTHEFIFAGELAIPRSDHTATLLPDGRVLVVGGYDTVETRTNSVEIYHPNVSREASWQMGPSLTESRANHVAITLDNGMVMVAGGESNEHELDSLVFYNSVTNQWIAPIYSLSIRRTSPSATLLHDGRVLFAGGSDGTYYTSLAEIYHPNSGQSTLLASKLSKGRLLHTAHRLKDDRILIVGGYCGLDCSILKDDLFDPQQDTFMPISHVGNPPIFHAAVKLDTGDVLVMGGMAKLDLNKVVLFTLRQGGFWISLPPMAYGRFKHTATRLHDGSVLVIGGLASLGGEIRSQAERFYP